MTTLATRTEQHPAVIDGELVEAVSTNPYTVHLIGSAAAVSVAMAGSAWSLIHGYERADLSFGLLIGLVAVLVAYARRHNGWRG